MKNWFIVVLLLGIIGGVIGALAVQSLGNSARDAIIDIPKTEISSYTLLQRMASNQNDFVVIDARDKASYDLGHIKGAISFTFSDLANDSAIAALPRDKDLVFYCWSHECMLAPTVMASLAEKGITNMKELRIGWCEWAERGYPIEGQRYIVSDECLVPQRSIGNETVELINGSNTCSGDGSC